MKIYYKIADLSIDNEEKCQAIINELEEMPDILKIVKPALGLYIDSENKYIHYFYEYMKYKIMWSLRSLENEIDSENGMIIIGKEGEYEVKNFSPELTYQIRELLNSIN